MDCAVLKSFTYNGQGGNKAGVVLLDEIVADKLLQDVARNINLSETVFVRKSDEQNFDVRFFTPVCEVDLCGHGTVAAFYYLCMTGFIKNCGVSKRVYQNTKSGRLAVDIYFKDNDVDCVFMEQTKLQIYGKLAEDMVCKLYESLNISADCVGLNQYDIQPTIVSTGLNDIIIPVKSRKILNEIEPDFSFISDISISQGVVGYHVFTIEENQIYARNFAPAVGINEECATGTSNGALCSLLYMKGIIGEYNEIIQGESMNQKSIVCVKTSWFKDCINVEVGGKAVLTEYIKIKLK